MTADSCFCNPIVNCFSKETLDFAAYVAKDQQFGRACFVLECGSGLAQDVITTVGQAFELRFKQFLKRTTTSIADNGLCNKPLDSNLKLKTSTPSTQRNDDREYYNDLPGKIPPDVAANGSGNKNINKDDQLQQVSLIDLNDDLQLIHSQSSSVVTSVKSKLLPSDPQYVNCMADNKDPFDMRMFSYILPLFYVNFCSIP